MKRLDKRKFKGRQNGSMIRSRTSNRSSFLSTIAIINAIAYATTYFSVATNAHATTTINEKNNDDNNNDANLKSLSVSYENTLSAKDIDNKDNTNTNNYNYNNDNNNNNKNSNSNSNKEDDENNNNLNDLKYEYEFKYNNNNDNYNSDTKLEKGEGEEINCKEVHFSTIQFSAANVSLREFVVTGNPGCTNEITIDIAPVHGVGMYAYSVYMCVFMHVQKSPLSTLLYKCVYL